MSRISGRERGNAVVIAGDGNGLDQPIIHYRAHYLLSTFRGHNARTHGRHAAYASSARIDLADLRFPY
jgi:hypothetical protein